MRNDGRLSRSPETAVQGGKKNSKFIWNFNNDNTLENEGDEKLEAQVRNGYYSKVLP
jgi:hypothetical protein